MFEFHLQSIQKARSIAPVVFPTASSDPANDPRAPTIPSRQTQSTAPVSATEATREIKREPPIKLYSRSTLPEAEEAENKNASSAGGTTAPTTQRIKRRYGNINIERSGGPLDS